jgi:methylated-DNA-protein-cysteine methyltransferase-like protein
VPRRPPRPPKGEPWSDDHEPTTFQREVVAAVAALAAGDLATYGDIAEQLGRPGGAQAVANVVRAAPDLPWWRVVPADGRVYRSHRPTQVPLLRAEGHAVDDDGRIRAAD